MPLDRPARAAFGGRTGPAAGGLATDSIYSARRGCRKCDSATQGGRSRAAALAAKPLALGRQVSPHARRRHLPAPGPQSRLVSMPTLALSRSDRVLAPSMRWVVSLVPVMR